MSFYRSLSDYLKPNPQIQPLHRRGQCVVVQDLYPKGKHHYLVMHQQLRLMSVYDCQPEHLNDLNEVLMCAQEYLEMIKVRRDQVWLGFHAIPSMTPLHLHIISKDMLGSCLKTKAHYNSFVTEFLVPLDLVINCLKEDGSKFCVSRRLKSKIHYDSLLKLDLKCHLCGLEMKNMPTLKSHLQSHAAPQHQL
ncbi:hypothetical protein MP228_004860 [Amoeboaphelidium protococcarum]|nr:hypothetical protein MP228_004860 [Amoeboaphelidium protococcarum]